MVSNEIITSKYYRLINALEIEVSENKSIYEFLNYVKNKEFIFASSDAHIRQSELKEFVRSINRYSDEFSFTNKYYAEIKKAIYELYDVLSTLLGK